MKIIQSSLSPYLIKKVPPEGMLFDLLSKQADEQGTQQHLPRQH